MDDYVRFNAYGNLDSVSKYEYEDDLISNAEEIFETWYEEYQNNNVDTYDSELIELIEEKEKNENGK